MPTNTDPRSVLQGIIANSQISVLQKRTASPPPDLAPVYKSRIKMIAIGMEFRTRVENGEINEYVQSVPYVLMHDDRIFQYNSDAEEWDELPPLPE